MVIDTVLLSRTQFGFTIGFHILFPTLNIGLATFLAIMEGLWLKTKDNSYLVICKFWTKIFALTFGMGVVSGIVLSYELGTNFGNFTYAIGSVLGPLFAFEVLSAFFLEAGFLGIMLFGWERVGKGIHYAATLLVTLGTTISAFWIMSANSWMQTPSGYHQSGGIFFVDSWMGAIFNPSFLPRFFHMVMASYLTAAFVLAGVSAWFLLKKRHLPIAKKVFQFGLLSAAILAPIQIGIGDTVGLVVHEHQPLKTAAIEGVWNTQTGAPFVIFGIPDTKQELNHFELDIPFLASFINTHRLQGELIGLKSVSPENRPLVVTVFFAFRIMMAIGFFMLAVSWVALWLWWRNKLFVTTWFLRLAVLIAPLGFLSTIAGWLTAESGRQPWIVYGLMKTAEGASIVPLHQVVTSLILFIIAYAIVFSFYLFYLFKVIAKGPEEVIKHVEDKRDQLPFSYMASEVK